MAASLAAFVTWVVVTDAYRGAASIPNLLMILLGVAVAAFLLLAVAAVLRLTGGIILFGLAWFDRLRNWEPLSPAGNAPSAALRRSALRHSAIATALLVAVSILVPVAWVA